MFCENSYAYLFPDFTLYNLITASKLLKITAHCTSRDTCRLDPLSCRIWRVHAYRNNIIIIHLYNSLIHLVTPFPRPPQKKNSGIIFAVTVKPAKPWTLEIFQECWLCRNQSRQRSGHVNWPQNPKQINVLACRLVSRNTITF